MCVCVGLAVGCSKKYTVTFDAAGGAFSGGRPTVEVKVAKGEAVDIEEEPTKESANFLYWAVNGQEYVFSTPVNGNLTISAFWQEIYTVTFSAGDGAFVGGGKTESVTVLEGESVLPTENEPTLADAKFLCWTLGGSEYDFTSAVNSNITLVAKYKPLGTYAVNYKNGEGYKVEGITDGELVKEGEKVSFTLDIGAFYTDPALVMANGAEVAADENGVYTFTVETETEITVVGVSKDVSNMVGAGTEENPYFVSRPIDLLFIAEKVNSGLVAYVNAYYQFANDIDMKGEELQVIGNGNPVNVGGGQVINSYFGGYVHGMGFTVSNYVINSNTRYAGLFGQVVCDPSNGHYGTIYDLHLDNFEMNVSFPDIEDPTLSAGSLIGYGIGANVYLCSATNGAISVSASDEYYSTIVGGLIGVQEALIYEQIAFNSAAVYCNTDVDVFIESGKALFAGGISGYVYSSDIYAVGYIVNSYSKGYVSGAVSVGGIAGCLGQYNSVTNCYSTSNLAAESYITNQTDLYLYCFAYAGGIVGMAENDAFINSCFATGSYTAYSNMGLDGYEITDGICAGRINEYSTTVDAKPCVIRGSVYAKGGKDTANGVDLTSPDYLKNTLGWKEYDWVFESGKYPVFNMESSDVNFNFIINYSGRTVGDLTEFNVLIEGSYLPLAFLYINAYAYEYVVAETEEISYGLFFDEELTQRVPLSFVITDTVTVYAGFADYTNVVGKYLVQTGNSESPAYITLAKDGTMTYTDGKAVSVSYYVYDGEDIIMYSVRLARYSSGELVGDHLALYDFKAQIEWAGDKIASLKMYDGTYYTEQKPLFATANIGAEGSYYTATEMVRLYADFTGVYEKDGVKTAFEYEIKADGSVFFTVNQDDFTLVIGETSATLNGAQAKQTDEFEGSWVRSAAVNKVYTFNGMGGWSYEYYGYDRTSATAVKSVIESASGSYVYNENGSISLVGTGITAYFKDGVLVIENEIGGQSYAHEYYAYGSYAGEWRDNRNGATLYLYGIRADGVGEGYIEYDSGYYYYLNYSAESASEISIYSGVDFFGYFSYNVNADVLTAALYRGETEAITYGFTFNRKDDISGEWISENELFEMIAFGGFGAYSGDELTVGVENAEKVKYFLENATQNGRFEYNGKTYYFTYDDVTERLTVRSDDFFVELERKDELAGLVYVDKNGVEYVFDGRGNLSGGGTLTVTADGVTSYGYKITSNGVDVYDGDVKMGEIKEEGSVYRFTVNGEYTDLYFKTPYTGVWAVSGSYGLLEIGGVDMNGKIDGKYLGKIVEMEYFGDYLIFFYQTFDRYVFILDDDNPETEEVEYCLAVSDYEVFVQNGYKICSRIDDMFGTWTQNGSKKEFRFDGVTDSNYVNGYAEIAMGASATGYYYRNDGNGGLMIWSRELDTTLIYRTEWCGVDEAGAYVNADRSKAFKLVEVDALYTISATDKSNGRVYTFNGEGTVECEGEQYSYEIVKYDDGEILITIVIEGVEYDAIVSSYGEVVIEFVDYGKKE